MTPVRQCSAEILAAQPGTGAAFAAWSEGRPVVDLWGGYADTARHRRWEAGSLVQPYSASKPFAAVCALRLVQAGRLDLDALVQRYWPVFRAPAMVRHVLSHQAGVVMLDRQVPTEAFYDWDRLYALLAAQQSAWPPGTAHGESALFYGHLVGELVRRVDGRSLGRFLVAARSDVSSPRTAAPRLLPPGLGIVLEQEAPKTADATRRPGRLPADRRRRDERCRP